MQLSVLGGLALLAKAIGYYLDRFDLDLNSIKLTEQRPSPTGPS